MVRLLVAAILLCVSFSAHAQSQDKIDAPAVIDPNNPPVYPIGQTIEEQMVYFRIGQSVGEIKGVTQNVTMNALGYLRYTDEFIYGIEYSSYYAGDSDLRTNSMQIVGGYHHAWSKQFVPYILLQYGTSQYSGISTSSGIGTTIDFGMELIKTHKIKGSLGIRKTMITSPDSNLSHVDYTDLYLMIGYVF